VSDPDEVAESSISVRDAARLLGRHPETIRRWVWTGRVRARRHGNRLLLDRAEIDAAAARDGTSRHAMSLADWAKRVRTTHDGRGSGESAADLVIGDREARSQAGERAGR
jgi:excisionase family DNA binding protein